MVGAGKWLVIAGTALVAVGAILWGLGKLGFRGLPGDIQYESPRFSFYFPIVTCLLLSGILTLGLWLWNWLERR